MRIKAATMEDYDIAFSYFEKLWTFNTYDYEETKKVYEKVLADDNSVVFFALDDAGNYHGLCHGSYFETFWMTGCTCYVASLITNKEDRGKGYGKFLLDYVKEKSKEKDCKALILDSGLPRVEAHGFYEHYGFAKNCYGFQLVL